MKLLSSILFAWGLVRVLLHTLDPMFTAIQINSLWQFVFMLIMYWWYFRRKLTSIAESLDSKLWSLFTKYKRSTSISVSTQHSCWLRICDTLLCFSTSGLNIFISPFRAHFWPWQAFSTLRIRVTTGLWDHL